MPLGGPVYLSPIPLSIEKDDVEIVNPTNTVNFYGPRFKVTDDGNGQATVTDPMTAPWIGCRYFAVDYDNGNDSNAGFSDVSLAAAGAVAIKTLEHLKAILPQNGNGQRALVGIRARAAGATYRNIANSADDNLDLSNSVFAYRQLVIRGTNTVATANTVAFSNDAADKITCGAGIVSGTNATGYNPTGSPTTSVISCQLNGGGAAGLAAELTLTGTRIRFAYNTATSALQNAVGMIWSNTSSQITLATNLGATPSTSDVFYIEEPATAISNCYISSTNAYSTVVGTFTTAGLQIVGLKFVGSTAPVIQQRSDTGLLNLSFISVPNSNSFSAVSIAQTFDFRVGSTYSDELASPATITTGAGLVSEGAITVTNAKQVIITHNVTRQARPQLLNIDVLTAGSSCVFYGGIILQNSCSNAALTNLGGNILGNAASTTNRRLRALSSAPVGDIIAITRSGIMLYGIDITGSGSGPMITIKGIGQGIAIHDCVGSTGNTGAGLDLTLARDCTILMGTLVANTFTGAAGQDITCSGSTYYVHADYTLVDLKDRQGNHIQGTGVPSLGTVTYVANDANANIAQYTLCKATASNVVRVAKADTNANASGIVGVCQSAFTTTQGAVICNGGGTWIQFDATPTIGNIAYLSDINAGQARDTPPTLSGTKQKLRLGRILAASGTKGFVSFFPESLPVLSDGAA